MSIVEREPSGFKITDMRLANLNMLGDNTQVHRFAQSASVSEAAKSFTRNLMCLTPW